MNYFKFLIVSLFLASSGAKAEGFLLNKDINKDKEKQNKNYSIILKREGSNIMNNSSTSFTEVENQKNIFNPKQNLGLLNNTLDKVVYNSNIKEIPLPTKIDFINIRNYLDKKTLKTNTVNNSINNNKEKNLTQFISNSYNVPPKTAEKIVSSAFKVSKDHKIDPVILLSITAVESNFDPKARNSSGAIGLVQAVPSAHPEKIRNIKKQGKSVYDIESNLDLGAQIYSEYLTKTKGNVSLALQRYNGSIKDSQKKYSKKVLKVMKPLQVAYNH